MKSGDPISKNDILLFCTLRNESIRIPFFLKYYREMGINHFFFIDNGSTDGFLDMVANENDITVYHTDASYKKSAFGMHWLNYLLSQYGVNHWCFTCDPDEFFVFPDVGSEGMLGLIKYLERKNKDSFSTILIDMYSKENLPYSEGSNPLDFCSYFDKNGYRFTPDPPTEGLWIQGGVRERFFCPDDPTKAPALNKIPLVYWRHNYVYSSSTHDLLPKRLNHASLASTTGALLHFKFLSTFREKVQEEIIRREHYNDSGEYKHYNNKINSLNFYDPDISVKYTGSKQLATLNLIKNT
jgi:hypothetical protein